MPTSNNPHSEGELHQSEIQQKAASQPLEDAAQNETSTEAANRLHSAEEKEGASAEGAPADESLSSLRHIPTQRKEQHLKIPTVKI